MILCRSRLNRRRKKIEKKTEKSIFAFGSHVDQFTRNRVISGNIKAMQSKIPHPSPLKLKSSNNIGQNLRSSTIKQSAAPSEVVNEKLIGKLNSKINKLYNWHLMEVDMVAKQQQELKRVTDELKMTKAMLRRYENMPEVPKGDHNSDDECSTELSNNNFDDEEKAEIITGSSTSSPVDKDIFYDEIPKLTITSKALTSKRSIVAKTMGENSILAKEEFKDWMLDTKEQLATTFTALQVLLKLSMNPNYKKEIIDNYRSRMEDVRIA